MKTLFVHYRDFQQCQATISLPVSCGKRQLSTANPWRYQTVALLKAGQASFKAENAIIYFKHVLKICQRISGLLNCMQEVQPQGFEGFLVTHSKPFPKNSTINIGKLNSHIQVSCYFTTLQMLRAEGGRWWFWRLKIVWLFSLVVEGFNFKVV